MDVSKRFVTFQYLSEIYSSGTTKPLSFQDVKLRHKISFAGIDLFSFELLFSAEVLATLVHKRFFKLRLKLYFVCWPACRQKDRSKCPYTGFFRK